MLWQYVKVLLGKYGLELRDVGRQQSGSSKCLLTTSGSLCKMLGGHSCGSEVDLSKFWEVIAVAQRSTSVSSGKMRVRNSQSPSPQSGLHVREGISSSSSSSWKRGVGPSRHNWRAQSSVLFWWVCSFRRTHPPLHRRGQRVISTSSFSQSTLGLWSLSQL